MQKIPDRDHDHACTTTTHTTQQHGAHYLQWHPLMEQVPPGTHPPTTGHIVRAGRHTRPKTTNI